MGSGSRRRTIAFADGIAMTTGATAPPRQSRAEHGNQPKRGNEPLARPRVRRPAYSGEAREHTARRSVWWRTGDGCAAALRCTRGMLTMLTIGTSRRGGVHRTHERRRRRRPARTEGIASELRTAAAHASSIVGRRRGDGTERNGTRQRVPPPAATSAYSGRIRTAASGPRGTTVPDAHARTVVDESRRVCVFARCVFLWRIVARDRVGEDSSVRPGAAAGPPAPTSSR